MNIAFFSKQLPSDEPNGVSVQVHRLACALTTLGHTVTVFSFSPKPTDAPYHVETLVPKTYGRAMRKFVAAGVFSSVNSTRFDILHYHGDDYLCHGSHRRVRTFYGSALREALHAKTAGRFFYQALFYLFEWVSCLKKGTLVAISDNTRRSLPMVKTTIPCGVPLDKFNPASVKTPYPSLLFLGDFRSRKRGSLLLEVFKTEVLPHIPDAKLTVVGPAPCSGQGIMYAGRLPEDALINEYRKHWVFCMPSSYEGFGVPMIEAMACGTPVVASGNSGSRALINNGVNGQLCSEKDLGATLRNLLCDGPLRERLSAEGIRTASSFDNMAVARRYEALYRAATAL